MTGPNNLNGIRFGNLVALERTSVKSFKSFYYLCLCDCGQYCMKVSNHLVSGNTKSCGCIKGGNRTIEIGNRYGRWTVLNRIKVAGRKYVSYRCICDCGTVKDVCGINLKNGVTTSCGCKQKELIGDKSSRWKGDSAVRPEEKRIRQSSEYKQWRTSVFERDNYKCCKCYQNTNSLRAHHINNFSQHESQRFDKNNGITLCDSCHIEFHKKYGNQNNNIEQLVEYTSLCPESAAHIFSFLGKS